MILETRALENLEVRGTEYPPLAGKKMAAQAVFYLQLVIFAVIAFGDHLFSHLGMSPPQLYMSMKENKLMSFMAIWLVGNMIQGNLLSTGAFEVYHGEQLIWSSLKEGRLPNMGDVVQVFGAAGVEFMQSATDA